ncbi:uncharacterized protein BO80DRAFT_203781 [Aspergillus ibericus CBS 121593]|uniref:Uncharacterized protein n=1 Tax=Aspergillus ibericus CBS 121593 TaxID=1448316 RepID=A0A395HAH5_9EURO|nr:hypothetical protein BO80DRAFT_203781 [Aspergillus ibericus CBS 121593]RAL04579.1 hypothetical protein BO80DRAFT_203781 [Aspergillus ibericus CBS 121593]
MNALLTIAGRPNGCEWSPPWTASSCGSCSTQGSPSIPPLMGPSGRPLSTLLLKELIEDHLRKAILDVVPSALMTDLIDMARLD